MNYALPALLAMLSERGRLPRYMVSRATCAACDHRNTFVHKTTAADHPCHRCGAIVAIPPPDAPLLPWKSRTRNGIPIA
jgi:ribosomal protein S27E